MSEFAGYPLVADTSREPIPVVVHRGVQTIEETVKYYTTVFLSVLVRSLLLWGLGALFFPTIITGFWMAVAIVVGVRILFGQFMFDNQAWTNQPYKKANA